MVSCSSASRYSSARETPAAWATAVAGGVAIGPRDVVEHVDDLGQQSGRQDREAGVLHVFAVGAAVPPDLGAESAQEREHFVDNGLVHHLGRGVLELAPTQCD